MPDTHYENPKLAEIYDLDSGWSADRDFYVSLARAKRLNILDLGCGTGLLCDAYASENHEVTGVDPSPAMLNVARRKPHANRIEWVQSPAQTFQSDKRYDLIIMTGHAFQVLLEDADVLATFGVMRKHLRPKGIAVFESRNPAIDWAGRWNYELELELSGGEMLLESRQFLAMENGRMTFELRYDLPNETLFSTSGLRFCTQDKIEKLLLASGLKLVELFGDWDETPFEEDKSEEMIFIVSAED